MTYGSSNIYCVYLYETFKQQGIIISHTAYIKENNFFNLILQNYNYYSIQITGAKEINPHVTSQVSCCIYNPRNFKCLPLHENSVLTTRIHAVGAVLNLHQGINQCHSNSKLQNASSYHLATKRIVGMYQMVWRRKHTSFFDCIRAS